MVVAFAKAKIAFYVLDASNQCISSCIPECPAYKAFIGGKSVLHGNHLEGYLFARKLFSFYSRYYRLLEKGAVTEYSPINLKVNLWRTPIE